MFCVFWRGRTKLRSKSTHKQSLQGETWRDAAQFQPLSATRANKKETVGGVTCPEEVGAKTRQPGDSVALLWTASKQSVSMVHKCRSRRKFSSFCYAGWLTFRLLATCVVCQHDKILDHILLEVKLVVNQPAPAVKCIADWTYGTLSQRHLL